MEDKKSNSYKKHETLNQNLDRIVEDLVHMFEEAYGLKLQSSEKLLFKAKSKSILYYWLGIVYDEATLEVKNLETALETSKMITRKLRDSEQNLQAIISSSIPSENKQILKQQNIATYAATSSSLPIVEKVENKFLSQVDSFYSQMQSKIIKDISNNLTPYPPPSRPTTKK